MSEDPTSTASFLKRAAARKIGRTAAHILDLVASGTHRQARLADETGVTMASINQHISRHIKAGYLTKTRRTDDERQITITLTPAGKAMHTHLFHGTPLPEKK